MIIFKKYFKVYIDNIRSTQGCPRDLEGAFLDLIKYIEAKWITVNSFRSSEWTHEKTLNMPKMTKINVYSNIFENSFDWSYMASTMFKLVQTDFIHSFQAHRKFKCQSTLIQVIRITKIISLSEYKKYKNSRFYSFLAMFSKYFLN